MKSNSTLSHSWRQSILRRMAAMGGLLLVISLLVAPLQAQDYSFSVPNLQFQVFVEEDGSARLVYDIAFANSNFGHVIDIVDIGMPHDDYNISNMTASVNGVSVGDIRPSEYVDPGVEVHLGGQSIAPGQAGTLHFEATVPDLVYQDVTNRDLASLQITPTWFGSDFLQGTTDVQIAIHLPEGVAPEELLYQDRPFSERVLFQSKAVAVWDLPGVRLTGPTRVGVSFPRDVMSNVISTSVWQLAWEWYQQQAGLRTALGFLAVLIFSIFFLRMTGGTGFSLWIAVMAGLVWLAVRQPGLHLVMFAPLVALLIFGERFRRTRKKRYLPPIAQVEGGGIKRGLTAPQAGALLEMPLNKVFTLIIFGLLKKGILRQAEASPLTVEVDPAFQARDAATKRGDRDKLRLQAAQEKGTVLHAYEQRFLDALEESAGTPVKDVDTSQAMEWFLRDVVRLMKGFDFSDTQDYYRAIVKKAVDEAQAMGDIPERDQALDRNLEWILMDERYPTVLGMPDYPYRPIWMRPLIVGTGSGSGGSSFGGGSRPSSSGGGPTFGDVAGGFAGWTENTMSSVASSIGPAVLTGGAIRGGALDLSGVDRTVGNVFEALGKGGGSGGGGGGCACAGCACACACAGGGR